LEEFKAKIAPLTRDAGKYMEGDDQKNSNRSGRLCLSDCIAGIAFFMGVTNGDI
jgi:hypothetical protein